MSFARRLFLVVSIVALSAPARAGNWAESLFAETHHDFGAVPRGSVVTHRFLLNNRTAEVVQLVDVHASCGCTSGKILTPKVPPGTTGIVEAQMDTRNFVGLKPTKLFVTVVTESGKQAEVALAVVSNILADVVLNPGSVDFGVVSRGQPAKRQITIERIEAPEWRATKMVSASRAIDAELKETSREGGHVAYLLTVALKPDAPAGPLKDEIRVLTNDPAAPSVPVMVTGVIRGELTASPSQLGLGRASSSTPLRGRVLVRAGRPFTVRSIEGHGDGLVVAVDSTEPRNVHILSVEFRPDECRERGEIRRALRVITDIAEEPAVEFQVGARLDQ
jgi:hypothetical protein